MKITKTHLQGCFICEPSVYMDSRGNFSEVFNKLEFEELTGVKTSFVQDNQSVSKKNVLRGFHFQIGNYAQSKLVRVVKGTILDVCVDLRKDSNTYLQHFKIELNDQNRKQLFIPKGFAHAFLTLSEEAIVSYKCDDYYNKEFERGIRYNDNQFAIDWPVASSDLIISKKDLNLPFFEEYHK